MNNELGIKSFNKIQDIRAVIFDLDGLIIDSEKIWRATDKALLGKEGIKFTEDIWKVIAGSGQKEVINFYKRDYGLKGGVNDLISERRSTFYNYAKDELKLMPGAEGIIKDFSKKYKMAIATGGHRKEKVIEILSRFNLEGFFPTIVSSDEVLNGKPNPDIYFYTAEKLGVEPKECLVLEDAPNGVMAGKRAGMTVFGINKNEEIREKLKESGADEVFPSLNEVQI